jgi:hypothetical protein
VISILQHLVGRIVTLEGNEPETTGLVVVWVTHNEYLDDGSELLEKVTNDTFVNAPVKTSDKNFTSSGRIGRARHVCHVPLRRSSVSLGVFKRSRVSGKGETLYVPTG